MLYSEPYSFRDQIFSINPSITIANEIITTGHSLNSLPAVLRRRIVTSLMALGFGGRDGLAGGECVSFSFGNFGGLRFGVLTAFVAD